jgi:hypothetical protein
MPSLMRTPSRASLTALLSLGTGKDSSSSAAAAGDGQQEDAETAAALAAAVAAATAAAAAAPPTNPSHFDQLFTMLDLDLAGTAADSSTGATAGAAAAEGSKDFSASVWDVLQVSNMFPILYIVIN